MIQGSQIFNFVERKVGVTQDGEKYIAINVLSKDNQKLSFISKKEELINKISSLPIRTPNEFNTKMIEHMYDILST